jgi:hypothetical protein
VRYLLQMDVRLYPNDGALPIAMMLAALRSAYWQNLDASAHHRPRKPMIQ